MSYREERKFSFQNLETNSSSPDFKESVGVDFTKYEETEYLAKLWNTTLKQGMHGICFSMYEDGQEPGDTITEEQVERRIKILKPYTKWIRSFS
ncbi:MAG: glycosyl hydrolase family 17 protein, partial [Flavobacteriales bacterium]